MRRPRQFLRSSYMLFLQVPFLPELLLRARDFFLLRQLFRRDPRRPGAYGEEAIEEIVAAARAPGPPCRWPARSEGWRRVAQATSRVRGEAGLRRHARAGARDGDRAGGAPVVRGPQARCDAAPLRRAPGDGRSAGVLVGAEGSLIRS